MTIAVSQTAPTPAGQELTLDTIRAATPLLRLVSSVHAFESVRKIAISVGRTQADLWILMDKEVLEDAHQIYLLQREFLQKVGEVALDLHVVPLSEVNERNLPPAETIFER